MSESQQTTAPQVATTASIPPASLDRLTFGWWNTSLSPNGEKRSDSQDQQNQQMQTASKIVSMMIDELEVDCLCLAEVTAENLRFLKGACTSRTLSTYFTPSQGRLVFDTGLVYDLTRLDILDKRVLTAEHARNSFKLTTHLTLLPVGAAEPLHLFVSHWPSRGSTEEMAVDRRTLATKLHARLEEIRNANPEAAIIVAGDFNEEPFDESLADHLLAVRDRKLAASHTDFLYNPFWRYLGEAMPFKPFESIRECAGTYFHKSGRHTKWRTLDQIMVSSKFLGSGNWHLIETETMVLNLQTVIDLIQPGKSIFDHLPVIATIERFE